MGIPFLFLITSLASFGSRAFTKLCSNMVDSRARYALCFGVNGLVACIFFFISGGFRIGVNLPTVLYAAVYTLFVIGSLFASLKLLHIASISGVNILSGALGLIFSSAIGFLFFFEKINAPKLIRIVLMIAATSLVFIGESRRNQKKEKVSEKNNLIPLFALIVLLALINSGVTVLTKLFTSSTQVTDENSLFFLTNVILLIGSACVFAFECFRKKGVFFDSVTLLRPRKLISLAGNTVCSNVGSLVGIRLVAQMDISVYTPICSALGILIGVVASLVFKEKLGIFSYLAATVACVALII